MDTRSLRKIWRKIFNLDWKLALFLTLLFGGARFVLVLSGAAGGDNSHVLRLFLVMWLVPVVFLSAKGRKEIGIRKVTKPIWLLYSFLLGGFFFVCTFLIFYLLYGYSMDNCFVYMARVYAVPPEVLETARLQFFLLSATISMLFSPVGEELLYRGVIHAGFATNVGEKKASLLDSLIFAIVHLPHFGILYIADKWTVPIIPAILWFSAMFFLGRLFFVCKQMCGSIWGAVLAHAGFNFCMMYVTFYYIL